NWRRARGSTWATTGIITGADGRGGEAVGKLSALAFLAVLGFAASGHGADEKAPGKLTPDYIKVEMRGKLRILPRAKDEDRWVQVVVRAVTGFGVKRYELDLPADQAVRELARKLDGK